MLKIVKKIFRIDFSCKWVIREEDGKASNALEKGKRRYKMQPLRKEMPYLARKKRFLYGKGKQE